MRFLAALALDLARDLGSLSKLIRHICCLFPTYLDQVFARVREGRRAMAGQATGQSACMSFIEAADRQLSEII